MSTPLTSIGVSNNVTVTAVERAERALRKFFLPHGAVFYGQGGSSESLRKVASYVLTSGLTRLRLADITTNVRDCRGKSVAFVNELVSPLVAGGWLAPLERGPMCHVWTVNRAAIDAKFEERAREETERKKSVRGLLKDLSVMDSDDPSV